MAKRSDNYIEKIKGLWPYLLLMIVGAFAYFLTKLAIPNGKTITQTSQEIPVRSSYPQQDEPLKASKTEREKKSQLDKSSLENGALPNQRVIAFKDAAALEAFLKRMGNGVHLLGRLDKLNALRIGFQNENDLLGLLDGSEETSFIYPVNIPEFSVGAQDGAVALENGLLKWLGITEDNSQWGAGIKIAILDTGIADHIVFKNGIERINLVPLPSDLSELNGHGTAVASLIFSNNPLAPGVAPGATPLSVRIANDNGSSDSFLIAQGIIAAVDARAQVINISLGGSGQSSLVDRALAYAKQAGVIVVASSGNSGTQGVMYPAANSSVIAVGAVDANNQHMAFSTSGSQVAMSAPGFGVNVAYPGDSAARVNGTSFSAPIITGTIAATMRNRGTQTLNGNTAVSTMYRYLNDIGTQGTDSLTGAGVPDMWRILNGNTAGIYDAAITSVSRGSSNQGNEIQVLVQNLGTEKLINTAVSVNINGRNTQANITTLAVGESRLVTIPVSGSEKLTIKSSVQLSGNQLDQRVNNNSNSQTIQFIQR